MKKNKMRMMEQQAMDTIITICWLQWSGGFKITLDGLETGAWVGTGRRVGGKKLCQSGQFRGQPSYHAKVCSGIHSSHKCSRANEVRSPLMATKARCVKGKVQQVCRVQLIRVTKIGITRPTHILLKCFVCFIFFFNYFFYILKTKSI